MIAMLPWLPFGLPSTILAESRLLIFTVAGSTFPVTLTPTTTTTTIRLAAEF